MARDYQKLTLLFKDCTCGWTSYGNKYGDLALVGAVMQGPSLVVCTQSASGEMLSNSIDAGVGASHLYSSNTSKGPNRVMHSSGSVGAHPNSADSSRCTSMAGGSTGCSSNGLMHCLTGPSISLVGNSRSSMFQADILQRVLQRVEHRGLLAVDDRATCGLWLCVVCLMRHIKSMQDEDQRPQADREKEAEALFVAPPGTTQHEPAAGRELFELVRYPTGKGFGMIMGVTNGGREALSLPGLGASLLVSGPLRLRNLKVGESRCAAIPRFVEQAPNIDVRCAASNTLPNVHL